MNTRLALTALCVAAMASGTPDTAHSRGKWAPQPQSQPQSRQTMTNDADASAQSSTDMSYGGTAETHSVSGPSRTGKVCWPQSKCPVPNPH